MPPTTAEYKSFDIFVLVMLLLLRVILGQLATDVAVRIHMENRSILVSRNDCIAFQFVYKVPSVLASKG